MSRNAMMNEITWPDYAARLRDENAIIFLPVGSLEQHGPQLPMGTDAFLSAHIARGIAERLNGVVAPPIPYGFKSQPRMGGGNHFPGTTSLDGSTLIAVVRDVLKEFCRHGAKRIVVLDGHFENMMFLIEAIDQTLKELRWEGVTDVRIVRLEYWDFTTKETLAKIFPNGFPGFELEHAALLETSMGMHAFPRLVHPDWIPDDPPASFPPYDMYPVEPASVPPSGVLSPAHGASAEYGRLLIEESVERISAVLATAFDERAARENSAK